MSTKKYRPYFTVAELKYLISACKNQQNPNLPLISYLEEFSIKIERGLRTENYTANPRPSIQERLGISIDSPESSAGSPAPGKSPADLYADWLIPENRIKMSPAELEIIQQYRYSNDLMDPIEESEYECSLLTSGRGN
jgi:hypothetical protein